MAHNIDKGKEFSDAVDSRDPDRIGEVLSGMSDSDFARMGRELWDRQENHVGNDEIDEAFKSFRSRTGCLIGMRPLSLRLALAGAAAVVIAGIGFWAGSSSAVRRTSETVRVIAWTEVCTDYGEISSVTLPDSSRVWLNAGSRILYPEEFIGPERKIYLSGEIYIEVEKDSLHPFIVDTGDADIRVTGTKFNLKAYQEDGTVTATLIEGGVSVEIPGCDTVALVPGRSLAYDRKKESLDMYQVNLESYPSWFEGDFNAYHMTLSQIARDLERRFGVEIVIRNPEIAEEMFYASFVNNEDVDRILDALNIGGEFTVTRSGNLIDIY